jgi:flagellar hook-associated protein 1 FlgK
MPSLIDILGIGRSGLFGAQTGIHTAGHNIANANNDKFTRQRNSFEANRPEIIRNGQLGQGVQLESVTRALDPLLERQIVSQKSILGEFSSQSSVLRDIEMYFNENNGSSVSKSMDKFFNSWRELSNNPADQTLRMDVLEKSEELTNMFHKDYNHIVDLQKGLNIDIKGKIDEINQLTENIATLNKKIHGSEVLPSSANDMRDQLDYSVKRISELIGVNVFTDEKGFTNILTTNGVPLVTGAEFNILSGHIGTDGLMEIHHIRPNGQETDITNIIDSGELGGIIYVRDTTLEGYKNNLNELAFEFTNQVNAVHQNGYDLNSTTGNNFFATLVSPTFAARDIDLSAAVFDNPDGIATSSILDLNGDVVQGNNETALELINLQNSLTMNGVSQTFNQYFRGLVYQIGNDKRANDSYIEVETSKEEQLNNFRESISGVSIDEEMIKVIEFQRSFEANSKVIKTTDQMLQVVLSLKD